ncbi:MAG: ATP-binding protein [Sulfuricurvum sp.]|uniref:ATP-binding protein n=1 Tax=Sulfuricurvum sp. TaxID=2025608 RepID=UPI002615A3B2|nr:ATP-binding protein [Sulfuricurvum sp.]MDD2830455.1 ATP-binding protein [Sulfuricurvum sp.]MDD4950163.1 ATP-binding protein [Sulfuricurvum sp.]
MSGVVSASIETIVNDLQDVTWEQVIFEAVTNSLQANATEINIKLNQFALEISDKRYIDQLVIEDNGDGFIKKNIESFQNYRSQLKKDLGCKGIGRFLYLKIFEKVCIESLDKQIDFVIDKDIKVEEIESKSQLTRVFFDKPKKQFTVDYDRLEQDLKDHFLAYFRLIDGEKEIKINIFENENSKKIIESSQIPKFETLPFKIHTHEFTLDYIFEDESIKNYDGFYCAGGRVVIRNSHLESKKKFHFFKNINILFLLSSKYFDNNVNETRDDFSIMPIRTNAGLFHDLSWKDIHEELVKKIKEIAKKHDIDIDEEAKKSLAIAREEAPYLAYYLTNNENGLDTVDLLHKAKKQFEEDKEALRNNDKKAVEDFDKILGVVTQAELAEYIFDRQKKIDRLKKLTDEKVIEQEIHNLFMQQHTEDDKEDYRKNNLWLFDDRFMTYDKVFSEAQLNKIFPQLPTIAKRPDILSIVSNTYQEDEITDIVIIELKRPDENITPAGAEEQLLTYARYINDSRENNKIRIWTYAFLNFTPQTEFNLDNKSYNKIPTQGGFPIYYKYHEKPNTIINFIDYKSLAFDADTRNKTFMKILNGETI